MGDPTAILRRHERMKTERMNSVENVWRDCFDYTFPLRGAGLNGSTVTAQAGQDSQARILDSTASDAANVLASNIMGGMTPANALWFALDTGDETPDERRWLDDGAKLLWENIHMANFDAEGFDAALDIVCAGQFALFIDEDREQGGFTFQQWPLATVYVGSTRSDGRIDIVHRAYKLTAEQAVNEFGENKVPEAIRKAAEGNKPDDEFEFIHALYPRMPHAVGAKQAKNLPVASCHIAVEHKMLVRESGYHEMPVIVPRWARVPGSLYAIGPMYPALPDVRQLNMLKGFELDAADMAISGMWLAIDDGVLNPRTVKIGPRKLIVASDKDSLSPLQSGSDFTLSRDMVSQLQASIRKTLMADQLPPPDGPAKTAYEYSVRVELIRKLLGPIHGRLQAEYLKPMIERCFGLAYRAGVFAPPPQSLEGKVFSVRFMSPLARSQKLDEVIAIEGIYASVALMAQTDPTILDELDNSKALEIMVEGRGAPHSIRRDPKDVVKLREARAKAQQQAQAEQGAQQAQQVGMEESAKVAATGGAGG